MVNLDYQGARTATVMVPFPVPLASLAPSQMGTVAVEPKLGLISAITVEFIHSVRPMNQPGISRL